MLINADKNKQIFCENIVDSPKGINPFGEFSCCVFKKCCKKYKKGKRCKKCPDR